MPETNQPGPKREEVIDVELGTLAQHIRVSAMPRDLPESTRFVGLENIASFEGDFVDLSSTSQVRSRVFHFQSGDVLYGRLRPYLRKAAVADFEGYASGEVIVLRCSEEILPRYLLILLLSDSFTQFVNARTKGDRPRTSFDTLASYRFELPSLETQEEICARELQLGEAVSRLKRASDSADGATEQILRFMRSKLIWESGGEEHRVPLADLVETIDYGTSQKSSYGGIGVPVLRIPNVSASGQIDGQDLKYATLTQRELDRSRVKTGDILLVRSNGSLSLVGRAALVGREHAGYAFAGYLLRLRPKAGVLSGYLFQIIRSEAFQRLVAAASRSSTGINNLSAGRLSQFEVPLLAMDRQQFVVDVLERLQGSVSSSSLSTHQALAYAQALHERSRSAWLGHNDLSNFARPGNTNSVETVQADQTHPKGRPMQQDVQTKMFEKLDALPGSKGEFVALFEGVQADYDEARDTVFRSLAATPPILTQVFDTDSQSIVLRRSN